MSKLISGKDALIALANGEEVEFQRESSGKWQNAMALNLFSFSSSLFEFRLKPRAITLNGVELPMPFKPEVGDIAYFLSEGYEDGYSFTDIFDTSPACFGYWKTEEEIKQVVAALRQVFGG